MLSRRGVRFTTRDLFKQPLTVEELRRLAAIAPNGLRGLLSTRSAQYRALGLDRPGVTDEALVAAMAREPRLVRRPLVLAGDRLVVGFDRSAMEAFGQMAYTAVFFDLFDTLVRFDRDRLPTIEVDGRVVKSTAGHLHVLLAPHVPGCTLPACYEALLASWQEAERLRSLDDREVPASARFADFFRRLQVDPASLPPGLDIALIEAHRRALSKAAEFPAHHGPLLERLARRHRLAVVSNFDYTPTALGILEAAGVLGLFEAVVVSDEVGWRKPRPDIFTAAFRRTGADPAGTLFVGDRVDIDVLGAHRVGMDAAWLNPAGESGPADAAPPRYVIRDLAELEEIAGR